MTTVKYGLGYNSEGVLGVAGLLGNASGSGFLGFSFFKADQYGTSPKNGLFFANGSSEPVLSTPALPAPSGYVFSATGNGIHARFANGSNYLEAGAAVLHYSTDGLEYTAVSAINGVDITNINSWQSNRIIGLVFGAGKFHIIASVYSGGMWNSYYTSTTDFVSFTEFSYIPISSSGIYATHYSGIGVRSTDTITVHPTTGELLITSMMSGAYYSADGITWTGVMAGSRTNLAITEAGAYKIYVSSMGTRRITKYLVTSPTGAITLSQMLQAEQLNQVENKDLGEGLTTAEVQGNLLIGLYYDKMMFPNNYYIRAYNIDSVMSDSSPMGYAFANLTGTGIASGYNNDYGLISANGKVYVTNLNNQTGRIHLSEVVVDAATATIGLNNVIDYTPDIQEFNRYELAAG